MLSILRLVTLHWLARKPLCFIKNQKWLSNLMSSWKGWKNILLDSNIEGRRRSKSTWKGKLELLRILNKLTCRMVERLQLKKSSIWKNMSIKPWRDNTTPEIVWEVNHFITKMVKSQQTNRRGSMLLVLTRKRTSKAPAITLWLIKSGPSKAITTSNLSMWVIKPYPIQAKLQLEWFRPMESSQKRSKYPICSKISPSTQGVKRGEEK